MKTSIATATLYGELREKLAAIARAGFDGVEIFEADVIAFDGPPADIGKMARDHGLTIDLYQPMRGFEGLPEPLRKRAFDRVETKFDLIEELGTDLLAVTSSSHPESLGGIDRIAADFAELGERAARRGLRVGYEALSWGRHVSDYRDAWEVVRRAGQSTVGLVLDSFHTLVQHSDLDGIRGIPGDRIFHIQLADGPLIEMDPYYRSHHFRTLPGEGDLPLAEFMRAVAATGYRGPLALELFNDQIRGGNPRTLSVDGYRSLLALMDEVQRAEPGVMIDVPRMPPKGQAKGVEFVEFTANDTEAGTLCDLLRTLGFAPKARHISKDVTLWRQGDINIVVNTETEGYAHSAYVLHGTSVCDIGILVDDAETTAKRAVALGANIFSQRRGLGELDIPAVRAVGGSVLHFLDRKSELAEVWDTEFRLTDPPDPATPVGLTRIDHIAQTMTREELMTWTLFYTAVLDVEKAPTIGISDPLGVVQSRAIQSSDGALRLTLNGADTHHTLAGRFVSQGHGSSVQHLAFATDDIFATAMALEQNGFLALDIPQNYYTDLATRFDLDADAAEQLRRSNILYDEDGHGSFFQLYSRLYGNGFFFEIVQRRGNYDGYGAPNAAYRTAAQRRLAR